MWKIGLLGGSFNPAHMGHRHISLQAMKTLGLDEVWWLVSPQNPLKSRTGMAAYPERRASALAVMQRHPRLKICEIEQEQCLTYTLDTVIALQQQYKDYQFIWLMGADNLAQLHRWYGWRRLAAIIPLAVYDRAPYSHAALRGKAAIALSQKRITLPQMRHRLRQKKLRTGWCYLLLPRHPESSTRIRQSCHNPEKKQQNCNLK
jgi:nicotinate-nucleotide adenylyltransferase